MFERIARRYDLLNHVLSGNLDRRWRRIVARGLPVEAGARVLDLCGGTGDMSLAVWRHVPEARVVCCDFAHSMLVRAARKFRRRGADDRCSIVEADALRLPFGAGRFDAVTLAFGLRNLADPGTGLAEIRRVLRPGGVLAVLEFSRPAGPVVSRLYRLYLDRLLPRIGDAATGGSAYCYLSATIAGFPDPPAVAGRIREAGFAACGWKTLTGGIVAIHTAYR
jgi:demethylmenaquinone methyltransferase/2-methoxy-6-polyprenyl-1,4-benzoquinol methylase